MSDLIERQAAIDAAALSPAEWDWTYVKDIDGRIRTVGAEDRHVAYQKVGR